MATQLRRHFDEVCAVFFPRWRAASTWTVRTDRKIDAHGICYGDGRRLIVITSSPPVDLDLLLIHETCHALTGGGHGEPWLRRMGAAAATARQAGREALAAALDEEIASYRAAPTIRPGSIYGAIADALVDSPGASYIDMRRHLAREHGMTQKELESYCRRLRPVYEREARRAREAQAKQALLREQIECARRDGQS